MHCIKCPLSLYPPPTHPHTYTHTHTHRTHTHTHTLAHTHTHRTHTHTHRYLLELDCDGNPAWECITNVHQWLLKLLFTSKSNHQNPDRPLKGPGDLSSLPASLVIAQDIPPDLPPRRGTAYTDGESDHSRTMSTMSDISFASNTSYSSGESSVVTLIVRYFSHNI